MDHELRPHSIVRIGPKAGANAGKVASVRRVDGTAVTVVIDHPGGRRDLAVERTYHATELTVIAQATASPEVRAQRAIARLAADGLIRLAR